MIQFCPCVRTVHTLWRPFKEAWCVQGSHPKAVPSILCFCRVGACRLCVTLRYKSQGPVGTRLWGDNLELMLSAECSQHRIFYQWLNSHLNVWLLVKTSPAPHPDLHWGAPLSFEHDYNSSNDMFPPSCLLQASDQLRLYCCIHFWSRMVLDVDVDRQIADGCVGRQIYRGMDRWTNRTVLSHRQFLSGPKILGKSCNSLRLNVLN